MEKRQDPDKILAQIKNDESRKGTLKIFFGAVAGVGKTYAMLEAEKHRRKDGVDVVIGIVETHRRRETEALVEGFECLLRRTSVYKSVEIAEFDLEGALRRRPALILVDELAHTNAPGSRHAKRWQDVDELLKAGINVYTTLNVQHCESMNDLVAQITRVTVRETVPDSFLEKADEIELVDIPPEELLKRLGEGKVYLGEQAARAAEHFFRMGNLIALRQLALKYTSRNVDAKLRAYKDVHGISTVWKVGERFLVCISPNPQATKIIRAAKQIADELGAPWTVAYVEAFSAIVRDIDKERVQKMLRFAETAGATSVTLTGEDVVETIIAYCREKNIAKIVMGKPGKLRLRERLFGSFVDTLTRRCGEIDLYLISGEREETLPQESRHSLEAIPVRGIAWAFAVAGICTAVNMLLCPYLDSANLIMLYLSGIAWLAYGYGRRVAIIGTCVSVAAFDFFFIPPIYTFSVMDKGYVITFSVMLLVGLVIGSLTGRLRRQTQAMREREARTQVLYSLSRDLARSSIPEELFRILLAHVREYFKCPAVVFAETAGGTVAKAAAIGAEIGLSPKESEAAQWSWRHRTAAGKGTDTLAGAEGLYIPLVAAKDVVGVLGLYPEENKEYLHPDNRHVLEMFIRVHHHPPPPLSPYNRLRIPM
jgi:two-component system sensor histidine kinase KdpD